MKKYSFGQLVSLSGLTSNEAKNMVQKRIIRPDVQDTSGTGTHRVFGFLDVFEGSVLQRLNQIPGGIPTLALAAALVRLRFETASDNTPWSRFLNPLARTRGGLWLCLPPSWGDYRILEKAERDDLMNTCDGAIVVVRLDTLLIALEEKTVDFCSEAERGNAWRKREVPKARRH